MAIQILAEMYPLVHDDVFVFASVENGERPRLTITRHAHGYALLETTVLTSVAIDAQNGTLLILGARSVLDLLLNTATEETLQTNKHN